MQRTRIVAVPVDQSHSTFQWDRKAELEWQVEWEESNATEASCLLHIFFFSNILLGTLMVQTCAMRCFLLYIIYYPRPIVLKRQLVDGDYVQVSGRRIFRFERSDWWRMRCRFFFLLKVARFLEFHISYRIVLMRKENIIAFGSTGLPEKKITPLKDRLMLLSLFNTGKKRSNTGFNRVQWKKQCSKVSVVRQKEQWS